MAIASKTRKAAGKPGKKATGKVSKPASPKAKAGRQAAAKAPAAKKATTDKATANKAAPAAGKRKVPKKDVQEPERSSPAMAEVDEDVLEFIAAIDTFKKENGRPFPSWSEVLLIVRQLGYKR